MLTAIVATVLLAGTAEAKERRELTVEEQYELGLKYLRHESYVKALEQFNRIRNTHRDDPYSVKAELAIGDVYYRKREWDQARLAYEDFMRMHPRHPDLDYVVYRMGLSLYRKAPVVPGRDQTWTKQAVHTWAGFESRFPDSDYKVEVIDLLDESRDRLARKELEIARFYVRRHAWAAVSNRAEGMLRTYPDSGRASDALYLDGIAASYGQPDVLLWVRGRLEAKDPERLEKLDRRSARIVKRVARNAHTGEEAEAKTPVPPAPLASPPEESVPNDPSGNPANTTIPGGAPPTATEPTPPPEPNDESSEPTTEPATTP